MQQTYSNPVDREQGKPPGGSRFRSLVTNQSLQLTVLLASALWLRLYRIGVPADDFLSWRHTLCLMVARNFYQNGMALFYPQVDWRTLSDAPSMGILGGSELMIVPYLTAMLYHAFGLHDWVGRVIPIAASLGGLYYFYRLADRFYGMRAAAIATVLLMVMPYYLYCGRSHAAEPLAHSLGIATLYFFDGWLRGRRKRDFFLTAVLAALMLLSKPQMGVMAVPMLYLVVAHGAYRSRDVAKLAAFGVMVGTPFCLYLYWSFVVLAARDSLTLGGGFPFFPTGKHLGNPGYYWQIISQVWMASVTPIVCVWAIVGALLARPTTGGRLGVAWFAGGAMLFLIMPAASETNGYYQMIFEAPACLLAGAGIAALIDRPRIKWVSMASIPSAAVYALVIAQQMYEPVYASHAACGRWIDANTSKSATVLNAFQSTTLLYYADRTGWNSWLKSAGPHPIFDIETVESIKALGGDYVVAPYPYFDDAFYPDFDGVRDHLYSNYRSYKSADFAVFRLDQPADLTLPPDGRVAFGDPLARKYLRGAVGPDNRPPEGPGFVPIGPGKRVVIEFEPNRHPQDVVLELASMMPDHAITIRVNGVQHSLVCPEAGERMRFNLTPVPRPVDGNRYTIEITTTQANAQRIGLVLFEFGALSDG